MTRALLFAAAALCTACAPLRPSLPVFGGGPALNVPPAVRWDEQAVTNASAHVGWALAVPLAGRACAGRRGLWVAGLGWVGFTLLQEGLFHAPERPGPAYASEVRTDLLTRLLPTLLLLGWDAARGDR